MVKDHSDSERGNPPSCCSEIIYIYTHNDRKEMVLFNDALNTFYLRLYVASDIW